MANAIFVWGLARVLGGSVLLRVEDHDRERSRPEYERSILDDLDWLGLEPDIGSADEFRAGASAFRQSDRPEKFAHAAAALEAAGASYWCDCSRSSIASVTTPDLESGERPYPGTCRHRALSPSPDRTLRLRMSPDVEIFTDALLGPQTQRPAEQCGDMALRDRRGNWTYQFAVVVDDIEQEIDLVVRGEDLLSSTGRQMQLRRVLGATTEPIYLHHPLLLAPSGAKLSKSDGSTGIRELRNTGLSRDRVLGRAAHLAGMLPSERPLSPYALAELFSIAGR